MGTGIGNHAVASTSPRGQSMTFLTRARLGVATVDQAPCAYARGVAMLAKVLTVSDSVVAGHRVDTAGPALAARLEAAGFDVVVRRVVVDGVTSVAATLLELSAGFAGLIVTTGGTGLSPRDLTPEGTLEVIEREAPGFAERMRAASPFGALSRSRCGTIGRCLILNTPGSVRGAVESLEAVLDVLAHALALLDGSSDPHPPEIGGSTSISSEGPTG